MTDNRMLEEEDEELEMGDIPDSFCKLTDKDFPLFITYKKFSRMLRKTYGIDSQKPIIQQKLDAETGDVNSDDEEDFRQGSSFVNTSDASWAHLVNYNLFEKKYWRRLNLHKQKRNKLDCELIYSEFSIIKVCNSYFH